MVCIGYHRIQHKTLHRYFEESRVSFHINVEVLPPPEALPYLGQMIAYNNSNWSSVYQNPKKAQRRWVMITKVLSKTGAMVRARGMMYKAVDQSVILYGSNIWVVTVEMLKVLDGLHH